MHLIESKSFVRSSEYFGQMQTMGNSSSILLRQHSVHNLFSSGIWRYGPTSICSG